MYVIHLENIPSMYVPEEHLKSQSMWLINDDETSRMPITVDAVDFHNLSIDDENRSIEKKWNQMKILMVFGYTLLPGVCDVPPQHEHVESRIEEVPVEPPAPPVAAHEPPTPPVAAHEPPTPPVAAHAPTPPVAAHEPPTPPVTAPTPPVAAHELPTPTLAEPVRIPIQTTDQVSSDVIDTISQREPTSDPMVPVPPARPSTPESHMPLLVAKPTSTSINDGVKEIYNNNMIQHKFAKIYESIDKIKSNSALVMDLIQEFKLMKSKGINVGAALPDLETQYEELSSFEKCALEEINKINMLNKMLHDQIHALENKCIVKSKEIDETSN